MPEVKEIFMRSGGSDIDSLKELYDKNKEKLMKLRNRRPKKIKDKKHRPGKIVKPKKKPSYILPPTPTPRKIQELIKKGVLRKGEILVDVEVNGRNPETEEQVLKKASWSGLSLSKVPIGTTHISYNTALIAFCAIEQMIAAKSLKPGVYAPEEISEEDREVIIRFIEEKTNPVHFE
jgi:saccharopine dehydrogenase-like NADP-dependent oxidoreductase